MRRRYHIPQADHCNPRATAFRRIFIALLGWFVVLIASGRSSKSLFFAYSISVVDGEGNGGSSSEPEIWSFDFNLSGEQYRLDGLTVRSVHVDESFAGRESSTKNAGGGNKLTGLAVVDAPNSVSYASLSNSFEAHARVTQAVGTFRTFRIHWRFTCK